MTGDLRIVVDNLKLKLIGWIIVIVCRQNFQKDFLALLFFVFCYSITGGMICDCENSGNKQRKACQHQRVAAYKRLVAFSIAHRVMVRSLIGFVGKARD